MRVAAVKDTKDQEEDIVRMIDGQTNDTIVNTIVRTVEVEAHIENPEENQEEEMSPWVEVEAKAQEGTIPQIDSTLRTVEMT